MTGLTQGWVVASKAALAAVRAMSQPAPLDRDDRLQLSIAFTAAARASQQLQYMGREPRPTNDSGAYVPR